MARMASFINSMWTKFVQSMTRPSTKEHSLPEPKHSTPVKRTQRAGTDIDDDNLESSDSDFDTRERHYQMPKQKKQTRSRSMKFLNFTSDSDEGEQKHNIKPVSPPSTESTRSRKDIKPKRYDGENTDFKDFIKQFEVISHWNQWNEIEKAIQLAACLEGAAQCVFGDLPNEHMGSYTELVKALQNRFDPTMREAAHKAELRTRRRKKGETVEAYAQALRRLVSRAFPNLASAAREEYALDQFITGLTDEEVSRHTQLGRPQNLNDAITLVVEYEAYQKRARANRDLVKPDKVASVEESSKPADNAWLEDIKSSLEEMKMALAKKPASRSFQGNCFKCGKKGHKHAWCKASESQRTSNLN